MREKLFSSIKENMNENINNLDMSMNQRGLKTLICAKNKIRKGRKSLKEQRRVMGQAKN